MKKTWQEFKDFAVKGNIIDLAIAVVIGTAFGKIVSSFVSDIVMPIIDFLFGRVNLTSLTWVLRPELVKGVDIIKPAVVVNIGSFIQSVVDFLIISLSIFFIIRIIVKFKNKFISEKEGKRVEEPIILSKDQEILTEIRDILKNNKQ